MSAPSNGLARLLVGSTCIAVAALGIGCANQQGGAPGSGGAGALNSMEQARNLPIGTDTEIPAFAPRSINDVLQRLEAAAASSSELLKENIAVAERPVDELDTSSLLFTAQANRILGRHEVALKLAQRARSTAKSQGDDNYERSALRVQFATLDELGRYAEALDAARAAMSVGSTSPVPTTRIFAKALWLNGDLDGADKYVKETRILANQSSSATSDTLADMAESELLFLRGDYEPASELIEKALANNGAFSTDSFSAAGGGWTASQRNTTLVAYLYRLQALSMLKQGRLGRAEIAVRHAVDVVVDVFGRDSGQVVEALAILVDILMEQSRFDEAVKVNTLRTRMLMNMGNNERSLTLAQARMDLANVLVGKGEMDEAQRTVELVRASLGDGATGLFDVLDDDLSWVIAYIETGAPAKAGQWLDQLRARYSNTKSAHRLAVGELNALLGATFLARGESVKGRQLIEKELVWLLEPPGDNNALKRLRRDFILTRYVESLATDGVSPSSAFQRVGFAIFEQMRAGRVQQAIGLSAARASFSDPTLARLSRNEQDLRHAVAALEAVVVDATRGGAARQTALVDMSAFRHLQAAQTRHAGVLAQIREQFPQYASLLNPGVARVQTVQSSLNAGETLLATYTSTRSTFVWILRKGRPVAVHVAALGKSELTRIVNQLRNALDPQAETLGDVPRFNVAVAHNLYRTLLEPVAEHLKDSKQLIAATHGPLATLPLGVLVTSDKQLRNDDVLLFDSYRSVDWLANSHAITYVPSGTSLVALRGRAAAKTAPRAFLGFADPVFSPLETPAKGAPQKVKNRGKKSELKLRSAPTTSQMRQAGLAQLPRLEGTAQEITAVATTLSAEIPRDVFTRERASEGTLRKLDSSGDLARYRVVSFATHGLIPGDLDGLFEPAIALSHPNVARDGGDGLLTLSEILSLRTSADWIVLSACNTAAGDGAGAEALSGLGRAFFYAGAGAILATSWPVHTDATTEFMTSMFSKKTAAGNEGRGRAHHFATRAMIQSGVFRDDTNREMFSYAHPIFWAPFIVVGDGT